MEEEGIMKLFWKLSCILAIIAVLYVYIITPSINNGLPGSYHTVTITTKKCVVNKENDDWKYKELNHGEK